MKLEVLGTGTADGWPLASCSCAACMTARVAGAVRGQTAAVLDGTLLLDVGPQTAQAARHAGVDLSRLRHVLLSEVPVGLAQSGVPAAETSPGDPTSPFTSAFTSPFTWPGGLDVVGLAPVVEGAASWFSAHPKVRLVPLEAGQRVQLGAHEVKALAGSHEGAWPRVVYDVSTPGGRLLYAPRTGPLPEGTVAALGGASFDLVVLGETYGDQLSHPGDHLDLHSFPEQLRRLRAVGAVTRDTDVVAAHLSHANPPSTELARRLADWGARVVEDGAVLGWRPPPLAPLRTLVIGGTRSGKSLEAERMLTAEAQVTYVATAYPVEADPEWSERVSRHRRRRPAHWTTLETLDLVGLLAEDGGPLLVDCLTLWLTRVMDRHDAWDEATWRATGQRRVLAEIEALVHAWRTTRRRVVAVTNEVGQGVVPDNPAARRFRDQVGLLNSQVAAETEDVRWCVAGRVARL